MTSEFDIISRYFTRPAAQAKVGVGDDAAVLETSAGRELVVTTDTLVSGTHFFADAEPRALGHKALAVNLSDLAAMGARPRWALLALTLPQADERWLGEFSDGFFRLADSANVELVGGDTTRGPLSITVTVLGEVAPGQALRRDGARPGDDIWVSGVLGASALALLHLKGDLRLKGADLAQCMTRLTTPTPRVALGQGLVGVAHSAIDISDGLVADLGHIADCSSVRAEVNYDLVPCMPEVQALKSHLPVRGAILAGGDDYELLFTAPRACASQIEAISAANGVGLTRIGQIAEGKGVSVIDASGRTVDIGAAGFDHFR